MGTSAWGAIRRLATDLDDTILKDSKPCPGIEDAFGRWTATGRDLVFITGRPLYDVKADDVNRFGATAPPLYPLVGRQVRRVIAENGSVIWDPQTGEVIYLTEDGHGGLRRMTDPEAARHIREIDALQSILVMGMPDEGRDQLWRGRLMISTKQRFVDPGVVRMLIKHLGLHLDVVMNRDTVMVVPQGVDKAKALAFANALDGVSLDQTAGSGDAGNDVSFLGIVGLPIAVANAEEPVKEAVRARDGVVTTEDRGAGVIAVLDRVIELGHRMVARAGFGDQAVA